MVGRAEDDGLHGADGRKVEHCAGARQQEERPAVGRTPAQIGCERLLGRLIQALLHQVDDQGGRALGLQPDEQPEQRARHRGPVLDEAGERLLRPRPQRRVALPFRPGCSLAGRQPVEAEKGATGQGLGDASGEPRLAAAEWADDVGERSYLAQLEALAAPGPGKVEGDTGSGLGLQHAHNIGCGRRLASGEVVAKVAHLLCCDGQLAGPALQHRLMRLQGSLQIAVQDARHLGEAEAQRP